MVNGDVADCCYQHALRYDIGKEPFQTFQDAEALLHHLSANQSARTKCYDEQPENLVIEDFQRLTKVTERGGFLATLSPDDRPEWIHQAYDNILGVSHSHFWRLPKSISVVGLAVGVVAATNSPLFLPIVYHPGRLLWCSIIGLVIAGGVLCYNYYDHNKTVDFYLDKVKVD